jgi:2-C-methyl-D-erythritol 4-phosphate cytidylyltransferase / 2-C-methyl-D-erythritol 2,4-cyclodiphosphate synthase
MVEAPRVGLGFDVHPSDAARPLWLGGVLIEGSPGLAGHSDGDAACHALADALLGAAALGDVGMHFPDDDPSMAGITGTELLTRSLALVRDTGSALSSCDLTIVCERPVIAPHRDAMRERLAEILDLAVGRVAVKATRPEGLGLAGDGVGCLALVVLT